MQQVSTRWDVHFDAARGATGRILEGDPKPWSSRPPRALVWGSWHVLQQWTSDPWRDEKRGGTQNQCQEWLEQQHQMGVRHLLLGRNDQKVIEKVNVHADKWHSGAVSGVNGQLPHGTLVHQEAPADHQRNPLKAEEAGKEHYCHPQATQQKGILARNQQNCHLDCVKINQHLQADQLLDAFHFAYALLTLGHDLATGWRRYCCVIWRRTKPHR